MTMPSDRERGPNPALPPGPIPPRPAFPARGADEGPTPPYRPRRVSPGLAWRGVRRHRWRALAAWLIGSAGLVALILATVRPTYLASSMIRIEPGDRGRPGDAAFGEAQARRLTDPDVIASALAAHPEWLKRPPLAGSADPAAAVRAAASAVSEPGTDRVRVSMTSSDPETAAGVVNALAESFLRSAPDLGQEEAARRVGRLRQARADRADAVASGREAVAALVARVGGGDGRAARDRDSAALDAHGILAEEHLRADLDLIEARSRLDRLRAATAGLPPALPPPPSDEVVAAFYALPEVAAVRARWDRARDDLARADRTARSPSDPTRAAPRKRVEDLRRQLDLLWARLRPELEREPSGDREAEVREAAARVAGLETRLAQIGERIDRLDARTRAAGSDELRLGFARQDLARAEVVLDAVARDLDRAEREPGTPGPRFFRESRAVPPASPIVDHRPWALAAAPAGLLLIVVGFLAVAEARAGRVADADDFLARTRIEVLGVVPPLPGRASASGSARPREAARSRRDLDRFVRAVDLVRVAIGPGRDAPGRPRRSILITSAAGGEGKTTLAAQLAGRCVHAGLLTLLVDADVRDPTLSRMFDLPASPGLVDVLRGESAAEEAIVVIGEAGGFHFLPAGSARDDPARSLEGPGLGRLLAGARESFDLVIVDAPPVLALPDALTIGRWVDAAVLAVRHDQSRYPQVDRAARRLAAAGVPVLGAVIAGLRSRGAGSDHG